MCIGDEWYASSHGAWLKASACACCSGRDIKFAYRLKDASHSDGPANIVRKGLATKSDLGTHFRIEVPDLSTNTPAMQDFEWRHRGPQRLEGEDQARSGVSVLVQQSVGKAVARMSFGEKSGNVLSGDFVIEFLGAGCTYEGTWKMFAFVIGILGFPRTAVGGFW